MQPHANWFLLIWAAMNVSQLLLALLAALLMVSPVVSHCKRK